jgi:ferredoxin
MTTQNDWTRKELQGYLKEMTVVTVPVNIHIEGKQKILDFLTAKKILKQAKTIAIGNCGCRTRIKKCNSPLDVCISLDKQAENQIKQNQAKQTTINQALNTLKHAHKAGLINLAFTTIGEQKPKYICSCCSCCCHALSALLRFNMPEAVAASEHIAVQNTEKCTNCGTCVQRCKFHARQINQEKLTFNKNKCYGCGLCITTCPNNAITFAKRT